MRFRNRTQAGQLLAKALEQYRGEQVVVYALPRGGVVLGVEIARHLGKPLDLVISRKIGHPLNPEFAVCAVTEDGYVICNTDEVAALNMDWLDKEIKKGQAEARRRRGLYLAGRPPDSVKGKTAIITDDGVATGLSLLAAIQTVKERRPAKVVLALPVVPEDAASQLEEHEDVDEVVALERPAVFLGSVGAYYDEFDQVEDSEVVRLLGIYTTPTGTLGKLSQAPRYKNRGSDL